MLGSACAWLGARFAPDGEDWVTRRNASTAFRRRAAGGLLFTAVRHAATASLALGVAVASLVPTVDVTRSLPLELTASLTFVVDSTGDQADAVGNGVCLTASGTCTLRAAISEANRNAGHDTIAFAIPGAGVQRISPATALPSLTDTTGVTLDGYTQPGSAPNTEALVSNAQIKVELTGTGPSGIRGLFISSPYNVIRGLAFYNFRQTVWLYGSGAHHNELVGSFVGTDAGASFAASARVPSASGVVIQGGANANAIGKPGAENRNVLSGNAHMGVATYDNLTTANLVQNNIIGLDPSGTRAVPNRSHGVDVNTWTTDTLIGGTVAGERNVVSGNLEGGVEISHGTGTQRNKVIGNFIGTDPTGTSGPAYAANGKGGVHLEGMGNCVTENPPTGVCPADIGYNSVTDNVIGNNRAGGILVHKGAHHSTIAGNRIGVSANAAPIGNGLFAIRIEAGAQNNVVGPGNEIANNANGIQIQSIGTTPPNSTSSPTNGNKITRNSIHDNGTNPGIDLAPLYQVNQPGTADPNSNGGIAAPTLTSATPNSVSGTTCGGCAVEIFLADGSPGTNAPGELYLGTVAADASGNFTAPVPPSAQGRSVTVTATDAAANTSEFARGVLVPRGAVTLASDDSTLAVSDVSVVEGNSGPTPANFTITRSGDTSGTSTVKYATATTGTATSGSDYTAVPLTTVSFGPGETTKVVTVNVTGDVVSEPNEYFLVSLSAPTGAAISDSVGVGWILNDD